MRRALFLEPTVVLVAAAGPLAPPGVGVVGAALGRTALELLALARLGSLADFPDLAGLGGLGGFALRSRLGLLRRIGLRH